MQENMVDTSNTDTGSVGEGENTNTQEVKTFTQEEVNDIVAKRVSQIKNKYSDIDPSEYQQLRQFKESIEEEQLINRNEFEKVLSKHKEKANSEITQLRSELERIKVDGALINAASKAKAIAPEQVAKLLKEQVRLQGDGSVVVLDSDGNPKYNDDAEPMTVDALVESFLAENTFYRAAGPAGTGSQSNTGKVSSNEVDLASLDMHNPEHRAIYKKMRQQGKI